MSEIADSKGAVKAALYCAFNVFASTSIVFVNRIGEEAGEACVRPCVGLMDGALGCVWSGNVSPSFVAATARGGTGASRHSLCCCGCPPCRPRGHPAVFTTYKFRFVTTLTLIHTIFTWVSQAGPLTPQAGLARGGQLALGQPGPPSGALEAEGQDRVVVMSLWCAVDGDGKGHGSARPGWGEAEQPYQHMQSCCPVMVGCVGEGCRHAPAATSNQLCRGLCSPPASMCSSQTCSSCALPIP